MESAISFAHGDVIDGQIDLSRSGKKKKLKFEPFKMIVA